MLSALPTFLLTEACSLRHNMEKHCLCLAYVLVFQACVLCCVEQNKHSTSYVCFAYLTKTISVIIYSKSFFSIWKLVTHWEFLFVKKWQVFQLCFHFLNTKTKLLIGHIQHFHTKYISIPAIPGICWVLFWIQQIPAADTLKRFV